MFSLLYTAAVTVPPVVTIIFCWFCFAQTLDLSNRVIRFSGQHWQTPLIRSTEDWRTWWLGSANMQAFKPSKQAVQDVRTRQHQRGEDFHRTSRNSVAEQ